MKLKIYLHTYKYHLLMLLSIIIFSSFEVISKTMNGTLSGLQLTFYRFLIGGLFLLPFAIRDCIRSHFKLSLKSLLMFTGLGFLLVTVSMTLSQYGVFFSSASLSAVIFSSNTFFISLLSCILLKERLTPYKIGGLLIGIFGLVLTCTHLLFVPTNVTPRFILGIIFTCLSTLIFSFYSVINKKITLTGISTISCLSFTFILGAITLLPLLIYQGITQRINPFYFEAYTILPQFIYICILLTGIAYLFYYLALSKLDTAIGSMAFLLKPPLASFLAFIFLKETIYLNMVLGIILIILGLLISLLGNTTKVPVSQE